MRLRISLLALIIFLSVSAQAQDPGKVTVPVEERQAVKIAQLEIQIRNLEIKLLQIEIRDRLTKILRDAGIKEQDLGKYSFDPDTGDLIKK